jgi:hypothetical protein
VGEGSICSIQAAIEGYSIYPQFGVPVKPRHGVGGRLLLDSVADPRNGNW